MDGARMAMFDCLYRRLGELTAHLGRYASLQQQFLDIHQQMKPVIDRQAICASHPAVITQVGFARPGEIHTAVKLYLSLATLASKVQQALVEPKHAAVV